MSKEKTIAFHQAKSTLEGEMEGFKRAAEQDDRDLTEEWVDIICEVFGKDFRESLIEQWHRT